MPDIRLPEVRLPEVRLKDRLPEGLRDMSLDDIQKVVPEVHLPRIDLAAEARGAGRGAGKAAERASKAAEKAAARAARSVSDVLPRRSGPNPVPIAILFMLGGMIVGWLLATNPVTAGRVRELLDQARARWDRFRGGQTSDLEADEWDGEPQAFTESLRAPIAPAEPYAGTLSSSETGVAVGPGELPEGMGTSDPARAGANDRA
jgi:hypothetical protein